MYWRGWYAIHFRDEQWLDYHWLSGGEKPRMTGDTYRKNLRTTRRTDPQHPNFTGQARFKTFSCATRLISLPSTSGDRVAAERAFLTWKKT